MIFAKRYEEFIFHGEEINDEICGFIDYNIRQKLVAIMQKFAQPMTLYPNRYNQSYTEETDACEYACDQFNSIMGYTMINSGYNLACQCLAFIFSIIELQYDNLYDHQDEDSDPLFPYVIHEKQEFMQSINSFMAENDLPWCMHDGKMIKIDAQQFECDLKAKALEAMKELKDAEPKFQSAYTELTTAIEAFEKGDYQSAINNAGKSYESVLKVILGADRGNADKLTNQYMDQFLSVPDTMTKTGFREKVMMSLPYVRNNSGADHGAGAKEVVIAKPMAKLSINLAAALNTYLIEEYATSKGDTN
ncbi:MAG: abortive infection family protein [Ruminococcus sp.]|nr:abortive infection family protein [Ruminococcus sp.]